MRYLLFFVCVTFLLLIGCGKVPNPDGRLDVSGTITLNGGPFPGAEMCAIGLVPIDDKSLGSSSTTFDRNTGKFLFTRQDGLKPGKYKVVITAQAVFDKTTKQPVTPETMEGNDYKVNLVPPEFNKESKIEFEVVADQKNIFNYDVKTDYKPNTKPTERAIQQGKNSQ
ncbi:MAG: hypothetical protein LBQ50_05095 [Planctomycetaceae bacterium]|jgi:hypothetical protein|nr:hypothetical protein [Planctomycetaceae bacterium]